MNKWVELAACKGEDTSVFFPSTTATRKEIINQQARAKNICRRCPVAAECLLFAIQNDEEHGIWGSFGSKERNALKISFTQIDIDLCKSLVNREIKSIKAEIFKNSYGE